MFYREALKKDDKYLIKTMALFAWTPVHSFDPLPSTKIRNQKTNFEFLNHNSQKIKIGSLVFSFSNSFI